MATHKSVDIVQIPTHEHPPGVSRSNLNMAIASYRYTFKGTAKLWGSLGFCSVSSDNFFVVTYTCLSWLLLKPGPGPWTRTLKNLDPEKPGPEKP